MGFFSPAEVACNMIGIGKTKAYSTAGRLFLSGILAGMFIAFAAAGANTASCTIENPGAAKLIGACIFPAGLAMVLVAGSELFTGNCLIIVSVLERETELSRMLKNWALVYIGNFAGSMIVVFIVNCSGQLELFDGALAAATCKVAAGKASLTFGKAVLLGIGCNFLVCIAVWMSFAAKSVGGRILGLYMPVMLFVLCGFEHSVANMYYVPAGLVLKATSPDSAAGSDLTDLTWSGFFVNNLIPVTIGNIIGGMVLVGMMYWFIFVRKTEKK